jgi:RNA polymerase sigma-70 factor (ECF subfamily)
LLHDIFDLPFDQIADVLGRSTDAVKMLASRARRRVRVVSREANAGDGDDRAVVDAFLAAAGSGDLSALIALLAPDAELRAFNREGVSVVQGPAKIAAVLRPITVRGAAGVLILVHNRPITIMAFTVRDGLVAEIRAVTDPDRLAQLVPSWVA